jgi:hypothetical protein
MSVRKQVISASIVAIAIAIAAIAGATYLVTPTPQSSSTSGQTSGSSQTTIIGTTTGQSATKVAGQTGTLSLLLTDPPIVPTGVTGVYVTYGNVAVHVSGAGNQSGWTETQTTGTINLMKLVNVSTTIATVKVSSGVYDALRFNISSAQVTYNAKNYTAFVPRAMISMRISGGITVNPVNKSATIIDMYPTVVNIGSKSTPEFIVNAAASVYGVPHNDFNDQMSSIGSMMQLSGQAWWKQISEQNTANIQITSATLSSSSLSITIKNTGTKSVNLSAISVAPIGSDCASSGQNGKGHGNDMMPLCFAGSAFFIVQDNGTLTSLASLLPVHFMPYSNGESHESGIFANQGYLLAAGKSVTLTYSKAITFSLSMGMSQATGPVKGLQYSVTVTGQEALAETIVVAS